jgi:MFS family permease|tara:strand:- start:218 stop:1516 length:1299 start_codon:yes stop_codon:yes gene_type:complete
MDSSSQKNDVVKPSDIGMLLFLTLLNVINFIDRQLLVSLSNWIKPELHLSNFEFGLLAGFVFMFFYAVMGLFMGAIADRVNRTRLIAFGLGLWSLLTMLSGAAKGFASLALPRMFIGVGESTLTPASLSLLGDRFPARWQGLVVGIYGMGVSIGLGLSLLIVAYLEPIVGWRGCFYVLGGLGVVLALCMLFIKETPRKQPIDMSKGMLDVLSVGEISRDIRKLLMDLPALAATIIGSTVFVFALGASTFDQLWLVQERGFDRNEIAKTTAWIAILAGIFGNLVGGVGGDLFLRLTGVGRPYFLAFVMLMLAPLIITCRVVDPSNDWFWVGIFALYFQIGCFYGPAFGTIQDLVPPRKRGMMFGFSVLIIQIFGAASGAITAGFMIDFLERAEVVEPYSMTLVSTALISLLAVPIFMFAGRKFEDDLKLVRQY